MTIHRRFRSLRGHLAAGAFAGLPAGVVMAAWFSFMTRDGRRFELLRTIAEVMGTRALGWGLLIHLVLSVLFAAFLSWLLRPSVPAPNVLAWSTLYGIGLFLVMVYLVLPLLDPQMYAALQTQLWTFFLAHLLYGGLAGVFLVAWRLRRYWAPGLGRRGRILGSRR